MALSTGTQVPIEPPTPQTAGDCRVVLTGATPPPGKVDALERLPVADRPAIPKWHKQSTLWSRTPSPDKI